MAKELARLGYITRSAIFDLVLATSDRTGIGKLTQHFAASLAGKLKRDRVDGTGGDASSAGTKGKSFSVELSMDSAVMARCLAG